MHEGTTSGAERADLERLVGLDLRELTLETDWISRNYAEQNHMSANEFRALLFVIIAEGNGVRLTAGQLRKQMGLSGAAITYLVERMTAAGHLRRESDPSDRRKVILRYGDQGLEIARTFFTAVATYTRRALGDVPDADLLAAHRTFAAMVGAMKSFRADMPDAHSQP